MSLRHILTLTFFILLLNYVSEDLRLRKLKHEKPNQLRLYLTCLEKYRKTGIDQPQKICIDEIDKI